MNTILSAIVMWTLVQLIFVWFCARFAAVRELELKHYLELQDYLVRSGLDPHAHEPLPVPSTAGATSRRIPPAGVARA
jgi:hypothetical protein